MQMRPEYRREIGPLFPRHSGFRGGDGLGTFEMPTGAPSRPAAIIQNKWRLASLPAATTSAQNSRALRPAASLPDVGAVLRPKASGAARVSVSSRLRLGLAPRLRLIDPFALPPLAYRSSSRPICAPLRRCCLKNSFRFRPGLSVATRQRSHDGPSRTSEKWGCAPVDNEDNGDE